jgi:hypothetical protein
MVLGFPDLDNVNNFVLGIPDVSLTEELVTWNADLLMDIVRDRIVDLLNTWLTRRELLVKLSLYDWLQFCALTEVCSRCGQSQTTKSIDDETVMPSWHDCCCCGSLVLAAQLGGESIFDPIEACCILACVVLRQRDQRLRRENMLAIGMSK